MAVRFYIVSIILLSLSVSCLSDPVQNRNVVFKRTTGEDGDVEETTTKTQIDQLYQIYQATQNKVIQLNTEMSLFNNQLTSLREMVKMLTAGVSGDVAKLVFDIDTIKENQEKFQDETKAKFFQSAENVTAELSDVRYAIDVLNNDTGTKVETVQSTVDTLTTQVNSPVNLYQDCIQETRSCTNNQLETPFYWSSCDTDYLPMNVTGYYTLDMRCQYDKKSGYFDVAVLRSTGNGHYHCSCVSTSVDRSSGRFKLFLVPTLTCTLVVTRCPVSKILY